MRLGHGLASLIWAAVFAIATQFVAGSAFAHSGHVHDHSATPRASTIQVVDQEQSTTRVHVTQVGELNLSVPSQPDDRPGPPQSGGCTGGCCGNGIGCCGAVIAVSWNSLPDLRVKNATIPPTTPPSSGIDPEALRRPPRPLA